MPIISFEAAALSDQVKAKLIEKLTDTAVEVTGGLGRNDGSDLSINVKVL